MPARRASIPHSRDPLIGREADLATVENALTTHRLVTLTGIGGSGKTRLAQEVARRRVADGRSAAFIDLAALAGPALVPDEIARTLGLAERPAEPAEARIVEALSADDLLLVLDNLEHLLACRTFIDRLLSATEHVQVLATSRAPLHLPGELEYPVPGLAVTPSADPDGVPPAVALVVARAAEVGRHFDLARDAGTLAALCVRLDGLPLALELAARRTRVLSPAAILQRLEAGDAVLVDRERDDRHSSVEAVVAWSVGLLRDDERRCLAALGVFAGGFDPLAAAAVAGDDHLDEMLERLVELGLVRSVQGDPSVRFSLLETIRATALRDLEASGEDDAVRERHARYWLTLVEEARAAGRSANMGSWLDDMAMEIDNLRAALEWTAKRNPQLGLRLAAALEPVWLHGGRLLEGRDWLERLLEVAPASADRVPAMCVLSGIEWEIGLPERARSLAAEAVALARRSGDPRTLLEALHALGAVTDDDELALPMFAEARELAGVIGDARSAMMATATLANMLGRQGQEIRAQDLYGEVIVEANRLGDVLSQGMAEANLALVEAHLGDPERARELAAQAVLHLRLRDRGSFLAFGLGLSALLHIASGRLLDAWPLLAESGELIESSGSREMLPRYFEAVAALLLRLTAYEEGARALGAVVAAQETMGAVRDDVEAWVRTALERELGPVRYAAAREEGRRRDPDSEFARFRELLAGPPPDAIDLPPAEPARAGSAPLAGPNEMLTPREREVLALLADGQSDREIAERLFISPKTASVHVANIKAKLELESRVQLVLRARELLME